MSKDFQLYTENKKTYYGNEFKKIFPIHCLSNEKKDKLKFETHHYTDVFTKEIFAELPEKVYVENEEFIVSKNKRIIITSFDNKLNLWQNAPTFKSNKYFKAGTPILNSAGNIVSIITGSHNENYAISCFDGYSGKFETKYDWAETECENGIIYGNKVFSSREELYGYLKGRKFGDKIDFQAILVKAKIPRIVLLDLISGLEISHSYIRGNFETDVCTNYH